MNDPSKILIVDDDQELRELLVEVLGGYGFDPQAVRNGRELYAALDRERFDLILLDIMMPGEDGLALCRGLRAPGSVHARIPIIFLTALKDTADTVLGLEIGGDDYLSKPFQTRELIARIRAVLRRTQAAGSNSETSDPGGVRPENKPVNTLFSFGGWRLNALARHLIDAKGVVVPLSAAEFRLLSLFLERPHQVVTRDQIMDHLAERNLNIYDRSIDSQVSRLRSKLKDRELSLIRTMRGDGYMLAVSVTRGEP